MSRSCLRGVACAARKNVPEKCAATLYSYFSRLWFCSLYSVMSRHQCSVSVMCDVVISAFVVRGLEFLAVLARGVFGP